MPVQRSCQSVLPPKFAADLLLFFEQGHRILLDAQAAHDPGLHAQARLEAFTVADRPVVLHYVATHGQGLDKMAHVGEQPREAP